MINGPVSKEVVEIRHNGFGCIADVKDAEDYIQKYPEAHVVDALICDEDEPRWQWK